MINDFRNRDLKKENFVDRDLPPKANFAGTYIRGINFSGATLVDADFTGTTGGLSPQAVVGLCTFTIFLALLSGLITAYAGTIIGHIFADSLLLSQSVIAILILFGFITFRKGLGFGLGLISLITATGIVAIVAITPSIDIAGTTAVSSLALGGAIAGTVGIATTTSLSRFKKRSLTFTLLGLILGSLLGISTEEILANSIGAISVSVGVLILGTYIGKQALRGEDDRYRLIRNLSISLSTTGGTCFRGANLTNANFENATLCSTDFHGAILTRVCWLNAKLERANFDRTYMEDPLICQLLTTGNRGHKILRNLRNLNLRGVNLNNANLTQVDLEGTDLSNATLQGAKLSGSKLIQTQLHGTDLSQASLTGAYIQNWGISAGATSTKLDNIECDYVFTRLPTDDDPSPCRKPDQLNENFQDGDFRDFIAPMLEALKLYQQQNVDPRQIGKQFRTLDLVHHEKIDPTAAAITVAQITEEHPEANLKLIALEGRGDERIRLHAIVDNQADCSELHTNYFAKYNHIRGLSDYDTQALLTNDAKKADPIERLQRLLSIASQQTNFYITTNIHKVDTMHSNPGGLSQSVNGSTVYGGVQAIQGDGNNQTMETQVVHGSDAGRALTQADVVRLLGQIEQMIQQADLPPDIKEESSSYLGAAKKAVEKEEPKKALAAENLKGMAENLQSASKTMEASKSIWNTVKPVLEKLPTWFGVASNFFSF
jgi:uncharacterized protein YjbI with pentapeptide repeats